MTTKRDRPALPPQRMIAEANWILREWLAAGRSDRTGLDESVDAVVTRILRLATEPARESISHDV